MKPKPTLRHILLASSLLAASTSLHAQTNGTYTSQTGAWNQTSSWQGGTIATGVDATAFFTNDVTTGERTTSLGANRTIGHIVFTDADLSTPFNRIIANNILTLAVSSGSPSIDVTQSGRQLRITSQVSGNQGLTKTGAGILRLDSGSNNFTGEIVVNGGQLRYSNGTSRLGANPGSFVADHITLSGGASLISTDAVTTLGNRGITLGAGGGVIGTSFSSTIDVAITGSGSLGTSSFGTPSTLVLTGDNSYTGGTNIFVNTIRLGHANALPASTQVKLGAGTLDLNGYRPSLGTLEVSGNATLALGTGSGTLSFADCSALSWTGTLTLTGTLGANTVRFGSDANALTSDQLSRINGGNATLDADGYLYAPMIDEIHPFLLFNKSDIPALRARASGGMWATIAANAANAAQNLDYSNAGNYQTRTLLLKQIITSLSLTAVLDAQNGPAGYVDRFYEQFTTGIADLATDRPTAIWEGNTPVGSMLFDAILALDVFHHALDPGRRQIVHNLINQWVPTISGWDPSSQSVRALWALYQRDMAGYAANRTDFLAKFFANITADGIHVAGTGYSMARTTNSDREQKRLLFDIIERHSPEAISAAQRAHAAKFYEWLFGYGVGSNRKLHIFGDSSPTSALPANFRVGERYSIDALAHATARLPTNLPSPSGLPSYVLLPWNHASIPGKLPTSRVFPNGGAWLQDGTANGLSGAMWNAKISEYHTHKETNALSLIGYGNHLLTNAGYLGANAGGLGFSWDYINKRAVSGNTVLIDYPLTVASNASTTNDHANSKTGAGISTHLLSGAVDYARGDSGSALPNGKHFRHLLFVQPNDGLPGYWPVLDEVNGNAGTNNTHAAWHPYTLAIDTLVSGTHYRAQTRRLASNVFSEVGPLLHIHLTTPPANVQTLQGILAHFNNISFVAPFLYNTYDLDTNKQRRFGTVFFPQDASAAMPVLSRISGGNWNATRLDWPDGRFDLWVVPTNNAAATLANLSFAAKAAWFRCAADGTVLRQLLVEGTGSSVQYPGGNATLSATGTGTLYADPQKITAPTSNPASWNVSFPGVTVWYLSDGAEFTSSLPSGISGSLSANQAIRPEIKMEFTPGSALLSGTGLDPQKSYEWQHSADLTEWFRLGYPIRGKSETTEFGETGLPKQFFRIGVVD